MSETLRQKQSRFIRYLGDLIDFAYEAGFELTGGELYRTPEQAALNASSGAGIKNSLHTLRLAVDLHLFKDGVFLEHSEDYKPLGVFWESLAVDCVWGGRFSKPDGNHFSITHNGVK